MDEQMRQLGRVVLEGTATCAACGRQLFGGIASKETGARWHLECRPEGIDYPETGILFSIGLSCI